MSKPRRIQRRRERGWRKPPGAVDVGRLTKWGNPFEVLCANYRDGRPFYLGIRTSSGIVAHQAAARTEVWGELAMRYQVRAVAEAQAVRGFRQYLEHRPDLVAAARRELRGHDLMCGCNEDDPNCHADVWLEVANAA